MTRSEKKLEQEGKLAASQLLEENVIIPTETPDDLFQVAEKTYTEAEEDLLKFVEKLGERKSLIISIVLSSLFIIDFLFCYLLLPNIR